MAGDSDKRIFDMQADVCLALANPKRLQILNLLKDGEMSVARYDRRDGCQ